MRDSLQDFTGSVLHWYEKNARVLPWRVPPGSGQLPDPYHVWLSEVMLQQTTVAAVDSYFRRFTARWPDIRALAAAPDAEVMAAWAGLGYYARARNLLHCARAVAAAGGFPETEAGLLTLPGIGPYTAAAIAAIAFDRKATVVDGNVERVMARYFAVHERMPAAKPALRALAAALTPDSRPGDFAQAVMDLGATICTPRNPACGNCPAGAGCRARELGFVASLPARAPKAAKPIRNGQVWLAIRPDGAVLTVRRPAAGLLGGMAALPTGGWDGNAGGPPFDADWRDIGEVRHTFTHFHLRLRVMRASVAADTPGSFSPAGAVGFPTLFRKALSLAQPAVMA